VLAQQVDQVGTRGRVEAAGGLVQDQQIGMMPIASAIISLLPWPRDSLLTRSLAPSLNRRHSRSNQSSS